MGEKVKIKNTMLYNDRFGVLISKSDDPEDFWDFNVLLDDGEKIGVLDSQIERLNA